MTPEQREADRLLRQAWNAKPEQVMSRRRYRAQKRAAFTEEDRAQLNAKARRWWDGRPEEVLEARRTQLRAQYAALTEEQRAACPESVVAAERARQKEYDATRWAAKTAEGKRAEDDRIEKWRHAHADEQKEVDIAKRTALYDASAAEKAPLLFTDRLRQSSA